jgi:hypothetical protein
MSRAGASTGASEHKGFDTLMADVFPREDQACANIFGFEPRIPLQNRFRRISGRQHIQHVFHGKSAAADDRLRRCAKSIVAFRSAKVRLFRGAKNNFPISYFRAPSYRRKSAD